jgi:hypothetical protein
MKNTVNNGDWLQFGSYTSCYVCSFEKLQASVENFRGIL